MAKRLTVPEPDDQLLEAFRVFDKEGMGTGRLKVHVFLKIGIPTVL